MRQQFNKEINNGQFAARDIINNNFLNDDELKGLTDSELRQRLKIDRKRVGKARQHKYFNIGIGLFILGWIYPILMHGIPILKYINHNTIDIWTFIQALNNAMNYMKAVVLNSPIFTIVYMISMFIFLMLFTKKFHDESRYISKVQEEIIKIEDELRNRRI